MVTILPSVWYDGHVHYLANVNMPLCGLVSAFLVR